MIILKILGIIFICVVIFELIRILGSKIYNYYLKYKMEKEFNKLVDSIRFPDLSNIPFDEWDEGDEILEEKDNCNDPECFCNTDKQVIPVKKAIKKITEKKTVKKVAKKKSK